MHANNIFHSLAIRKKGKKMTLSRLKIAGVFALICLLGLGGLTSCGKRGDPVRPSEVEHTS
jgi:hypothetical protein